MIRHQVLLAVHVSLVAGERVFLLRRFQTGYEDGAYTVVAGHVDADESATAAAVREVMEEAGVVVCPEDLQFTGCMHRQFADGEAINLFFVTRRWTGDPTNAEPSKCDHADWYPFSALPDRMVPYVRSALEYFESGRPYLEYGWANED